MVHSAVLELAADAPAERDRVLIIGAGLAGLFLALKLAPRPCTIVSPAPLGQAASSAWAQGGLAVALHPHDSIEKHAADTVKAGAGLVDPVIARMITAEGPARVRDLISLGVPFDRTPDGQLALSLEAAHSHPRVARVAGDLAGHAIMTALTNAVRQTPRIEVIENTFAASLLQDEAGRIAGAILRDPSGRVRPFAATETILCTGGSGGLFRVTTNPPQARGEALAMAYHAGAVIADPEFIQFHPTAMDVGFDPAPLATEALRGEGATLINDQGVAFMTAYHRAGELAPRDEVARAIHAEILAGRHVFLDTREAIGAEIETLFPTVFAASQRAGLDPRRQPIPVAPAMHYHMGGILSDLWGRATLAGLSVCGECASTGAHGANRLASNSLLETVVMAARIADRLRDSVPEATRRSRGRVPPTLPDAPLQDLREAMDRHCGVVRTEQGLARLLDLIERHLDMYGDGHALVAAHLIAHAAYARTESRGGHFRSDFPNSSPTARHTYLQTETRYFIPNELTA